MKKIFFTTLIAILFLLTSCFTTVSVNSLAPAEVDLGADQVIAVASTKAFKTYGSFWGIPVYADEGVPVPKQIKNFDSTQDSSTGTRVAKYAAEAVSAALSEGVYQVVEPASTDLWSSSKNLLKSKGVTLLLESSIDAMNLEEFIEGHARKEKDGKTSYYYNLVQRVNISFSYRLTDLTTGKVIDAYAYSGQYPAYGDGVESTIATVDTNGKFEYHYFYLEEAEDLYKRAIDSFKEKIRDRLVPHTVQLNFNLMDTRDKAYSAINSLVNDGYISLAVDKFEEIYKNTADVVAGYNLAVLYYAQGMPEQAISFADSLYAKTLNADVGKLLQKMKTSYSQDKAAKSQAGLPNF